MNQGNTGMDSQKDKMLFFDILAQGVIYVDEKGLITHANRAAEHLLGLDSKELIGIAANHARWKAIKPDLTPYPEPHHPVFLALSSSLPVLNRVLGIMHPKQNKYIWLLINAVPEFVEGSKKPTSVFITFTDISDQIELEVKLRKKNKLLHLVTAIGQKFINIPLMQVQEEIAIAIAKLGKFTGAERLAIFDYDFNNNLAHYTYEWCAIGISSQKDKFSVIPIQEFSSWIDILKKGESINISNIQQIPLESPMRKLLEATEVVSLLAVPLIYQGECIGVIGLESVTKPQYFDSLEQDLLVIFSELLVNIKNRIQNESYRAKAELAVIESRSNLNERLKEQNCVYQITSLSQNEDLNAQEYFGEVVKILPPAFLLPEETSVMIYYDGECYYSENFSEKGRKQEFGFFIGNKPLGYVNIFISEATEFLPEELKMMETVVSIIRKYKAIKQSKRALVASEEKYRIIANNTYNWEFWQAPDGHFIYHSPSCERITGYTPDEVHNDDFIYNEIIHPEDREIYLAHKSKVLQHKCADKINFRIYSKEKELRIIEHVCQPVFNSMGVYLGTRGTNLDVTEAKQAEKLLFETKEMYRSLIESSDASIMLLNVEGEFLYANEIAATIFGKKPEDFINNKYTLYDLAPAEIATENMAYIEQVFFSKKGSILETHRNIDGQEYWFRNSIQPVKDTSGNITSVFVNSANITEQKTAEFRIKESELKYRTLFADSPDGYLIVKEGIFIDCNKASENILNSSREYIIGKTPQQISPEFQPDGQPSDDLVKKVIEQAFEKNRHQFEWAHLKPNGEIVYVDVILSPMVTGKEQFLFISWRDITEKKEAQILIKKLQSAVEKSPLSIFITDKDGTIEYVNPHTIVTTGYSYEELLGGNPRILKSGFTNPKVYEELWFTITNGNIWKGILNNRRKNGSLYWESTTITPILNEAGDIINFIAIKEDITERVKIEREIKSLNQNLERKINERTAELQNTNTALMLAKKEAEEANQAKSDFLSRMSHELRTPMNAILGFAQLLEMGDLNEKQIKSVHHILNSGQHLLNLINEVLEITRIESGKISISLEPVNIMNVFRDVIETLTPAANARNIQLINVQDGKESFFIKADKQRIKQVVINLVNNAIKYNRVGGWVKLSAVEIVKNDNAFIKLCIADNGPGIEPIHLKKLFIPFERIGAENSAVEGTGLGLAVVQQYTSLMGGICGVESIPNEGSVFWVELPKTQGLAETMQIKEEHFPVKPELVNIQHQAVVLYIEDNSSNIELVNQIIATTRPNVKIINSIYGRMAESLALEHHPHLILLDLNLPDIHGFEVFNILQQNNKLKNIPVVIVSADAVSLQVSRLLEAGARKYLTKPFDINDFLKIIDEYTMH